MQPGCISVRPSTARFGRAAAPVLALVLTLAATLLLAGCGSTPATPKTGSTAAGAVWLCRPGQTPDPCTTDLTATVVPAHGPRTVQHAQAAGQSAFDCFYVYPTVSTEPGDNADLRVQRAETDVAIAQASRFSQLCRVWAPVYRQRTEGSLLKGLGADPHADTVAYASLLAAWRDYLAHDNHGRPVVFIGHSQGAAVLIRLLAGQVDPDPALRSRTVLAILPGGNVTVPVSRSVGATFAHLPLCTATGQAGCVVAYSSFPGQPPADAEVGRPGQGVSLQSGQTATRGVQVACVDPAALAGGTGELVPYFPSGTGWVSYPDLYSATCRSAGGAAWLQVDRLDAAGRPTVTQPLGPAWGYHRADVNLALGNLISDLRTAESTYASEHPAAASSKPSG